MRDDHVKDFVVAMDSVGAEIATTTRRDKSAKRYMSSPMPAKSDRGAAISRRATAKDVFVSQFSAMGHKHYSG